MHVCTAFGRAEHYHTELSMLSHIKLCRAFVCQKLQNKSGVHEAGGATVHCFQCLKSTASYKKDSETEHVAVHNMLLLMEPQSKDHCLAPDGCERFSVLMAHSVHQRGAWKKSKSCRIKEEDQRLILNI